MVNRLIEWEQFVDFNALWLLVLAEALLLEFHPDEWIAQGFEFLFHDGGEIATADQLPFELLPNV